jgi:uncharacterized damage-inducible protein DinB
MVEGTDSQLLDALLEAWDRSNTVMVNLLRALPEGGLQSRATETGATVAQLIMHLHHERLMSVTEEAPEYAGEVPATEWDDAGDPDRLAQRLNESAKTVRDAVRGRILAGRDVDLHFGHPALLLQFLLWHDAYHHGQIKLALKLAGHPISDEVAGPLTWGVWRAKGDRALRSDP